MDKKELRKIIEKGESEKAEFKSSLSEWKDALRSLAAFSWEKGGRIVFGISRTGKIVGVKIGKGTIESLANSIKQNTDPKLYPSIKVFKIKDKDVILVETEKISNEPVLAFGKAYKRVGKSTHQMSREEYKRIIKNLSEQEFDGQICEKASLRDIDWETVNQFRERYEEINKTSIKSSNKELLKSLNCLKEVNNKLKVTNAGILLFSEKTKEFFPMSYVTVARYPGTEKGSKYLDIKDFYGNLFDIIDNVNSYIKEHVQEISEVVEGQIARKVIPQYPYFTIRELITNAVCHRDYANRGSRIIVRMFRDRIEFNSPGGLPANITPKNIVYEQYARNPIIADVLQRVKYIEKLGEGWDKIIEEHKKHPFKPKLPDIVDTGNTVIVMLYSPKEMVEKPETVEPIMSQLNERQKKAVDYVIQNKEISRKIYCKEFNIKKTIAHEELTQLVNKGIFEKVGEGRATHYILNRTISGRLADDSENEKNKQKGKEVEK